jgi:hypothetical protein
MIGRARACRLLGAEGLSAVLAAAGEGRYDTQGQMAFRNM